MNSQQRKLKKLRRMEAEIAYANPTRAAKLTTEIVRLKANVFDLSEKRR
jgi:hypothetical protein